MKAAIRQDCIQKVNIHIVIRAKNMYIDIFSAALLRKKPGS